MIDVAVTNSSCLIALELIGRLELLPRVCGRVLAPRAVAMEFGAEPEWLTIKAVSDSALVAALKTQAHEGEAEAIALAAETPGARVILDDKKARRIAREMGLSVVGTYGLLVRAKERGFIDAVKPIVAELEQAGLHTTRALLAEILAKANE